MKAIFCKALERFKICHPAMARQFGIELTNRRVYSRELSFGDSCANADQRPERFVQGDMNGAILLLALGRRLVHHDCTVPLAGSAQGLGQLVVNNSGGRHCLQASANSSGTATGEYGRDRVRPTPPGCA